jgi:hypothetical protein
MSSSPPSNRHHAIILFGFIYYSFWVIIALFGCE